MTTPSEQLGLHGGQPAVRASSGVWPPADDTIWQSLAACYQSGDWGRYHGQFTERLRETIQAVVGHQYVSLCCSGTFAVELALRGLGIGRDDEVLLAGYDFPGNFRSIAAAGAQPVLVDPAPGRATVDVAGWQQAVGPQTRAVVVSHLHGDLAPMRQIMNWAEQHNLRVVEDACQCPGAVVDGQPAGSWGDVGVFSFGGSKLLSAGRGGAVVTRYADVHQRAKVFCEQGNHAFPLSELQAAVLLPQWQALPQRNAQRSAAVAHLLRRLNSAGIEALRPVSQSATAENQPAYYKVGWVFIPALAEPATRATLIAAAQAEGIALDAGFRGFVQRGRRRCRQGMPLDRSAELARAAVLLHHPVLLEPGETLDQVADGLIKVVRWMAQRSA